MRHRTRTLILLACAGLTAPMVPAARASWTPDGLALSPNASNYKPVITSDGGTGTIVAWYGGSGSDIFATRILGDGSTAPGWPTASPLVVCGATGLQEQPTMVPDGAGGALIFWQDARNGSNYDIYGQHIDGSGLIPTNTSSNWVLNGNPISTAAGNQYTPMAVSDGVGGAIVVWQDGRNGAGNYDIYAQRVDANGNLMWPPGGLPVCTATNNQINPTITSDRSGGAFISWQDYRKGNEYDIYVQHLTSDGSIFPDQRWTVNGLGVCLATNSQFYPVLTGDGAGGVFAVWQDYRTGTDNHIFGQHLSAQGALVTGWPANGTPVCQAPFSQYYPTIDNDGGTGAFITWQDYRTGTTNHVYAQHLTSANVGWAPDGVIVSNAINGQFAPQVANDGQGGAFITWYDSRNGSSNDVYVHALNAQGTLNPLWDRDGLPVCLAPNTQQFPVLAKNGQGTTVMTWQDLRSGGLTTAAIFAQEVGGSGTAGIDLLKPKIAQVSAARPNPSRGASELQLTLPAPTFVRAEVLDVTGRRVTTIASQLFSAGTHALSWNGTNSRGAPVAPGVYLVHVSWPGFDKTQRVVRLR